MSVKLDQLHLVPFAVVMISAVVFSIRDSEWEKIKNSVKASIAKGVLFIDGNCLNCRQTGRFIKFLDWFSLLDVRSFRHDKEYEPYGVSLESLEREMHLIVICNQNAQVYKGFEAVKHTIIFLPAIWFAIPLMYFVGKIGLGSRLYKLLADNRIIIPDQTFII